MMQQFLVLVDCAWNYIVAKDTNEKLMQFFVWRSADSALKASNPLALKYVWYGRILHFNLASS
jgi:hypothetical protein